MKKIFILSFIFLFQAKLNAQCDGTTITLVWANDFTYYFSYDQMINGKCGYVCSNSATIGWNSSLSRWEIYSSFNYTGDAYWYSIANTSFMPPNSIVGNWVQNKNTIMNSLTGTGTIDVVLPITLINFNVYSQKHSNFLNWQTASEINTQHFEIERSKDGSNWISIGSIAAKGSGGNTYSYSDYSATTATAYYRLKMVDIDNRFTYSSVVKISANSPDNLVSVYPNPASETVTINVGQSYLNTMSQLVNTNGQVVQNIMLGNFQTQINVQGLSTGIYYLKFNDGSSQKLVIKH